MLVTLLAMLLLKREELRGELTEEGMLERRELGVEDERGEEDCEELRLLERALEATEEQLSRMRTVLLQIL